MSLKKKFFQLALIMLFFFLFAHVCVANTLLESANKGDMVSLRKELEKNIDIHIKNEDGYNALMLATIQGHIEIIEVLLAEGVDVYERTSAGKSVLLMAIESNNLAIVELLINNGADIYARTDDNLDAFMLAENLGYEDISEALKNFTLRDLNIDRIRYPSKEKFLEYAKRGDYKNIQKALKNKEDINMRDINGMTALMFAAKHNHPHTTGILLKNKANAHARNNGGWNAFMLAAVFGNKKVIEVFIENKIDPFVLDDEEQNALTLAEAEGHKEIVKILQKYMNSY